MKMIHTLRTIAFAVTACSVSQLSGQTISVVDSANVSGNADASSATISGFSLGSGNTLAVLIASENSSSTTPPSFTVTYGGNAVTNSITGTEGPSGAGVFYAIDSSTTSGDIVVTFNGTSNNAYYAVTALSLANVASVSGSGSFGYSDINPQQSRDISYDGTAGGYVLASFVDNDFQSGTSTYPNLTIVGDNINPGGGTADYLQYIGGTGAASTGRALAGASISSAGTFSETFTSGGSESLRNAGALVAFAAIPEPEAYSLLVGLGALAGIFCRRIRS